MHGQHFLNRDFRFFAWTKFHKLASFLPYYLHFTGGFQENHDFKFFVWTKIRENGQNWSTRKLIHKFISLSFTLSKVLLLGFLCILLQIQSILAVGYKTCDEIGERSECWRIYESVIIPIPYQNINGSVLLCDTRDIMFLFCKGLVIKTPMGALNSLQLRKREKFSWYRFTYALR